MSDDNRLLDESARVEKYCPFLNSGFRGHCIKNHCLAWENGCVIIETLKIIRKAIGKSPYRPAFMDTI